MNERRYEFGDENGAESWVCAKIPHDGAIKKDCVPKVIEIDSTIIRTYNLKLVNAVLRYIYIQELCLSHLDENFMIMQ